MTPILHGSEPIERRVIGAVRCIDATTRLTIESPLRLSIALTRIQRNRSGLYVIAATQALAAHEAAFGSPPPTPSLESVKLRAEVADPSGRYLPRSAVLALPRDPLPANAGDADSLFRPIELALYPSNVGPVGENWAVLHVNLTDAGSGDALGGALLLASGGASLARALTDWRGEALLTVPGVPVTTWSSDPHAVVVSEIAIQVKFVFDPASGTRTSAADVEAGRVPLALPMVDPDDIEARADTLPNASVSVKVAARRRQSLFSRLVLP